MNHKSRLVFLDKIAIAGEAPVAPVLGIVDVTRGSMGNQHIQLLQSPQGKPELTYLSPHLTLPELVGIAIVPAGP